VHSLSSDQLQYRKLAREFVEREILPAVASSHTNNIEPKALLEKLRALGLVNVRIPENFAGLGLKTIDACLIAEELAFGENSLASSFEASELASTALLNFASHEQNNRFLRTLASTTDFAGLCMPCENDCLELTLQAVQSHEDFILNGQCNAVINGRAANWIFVVARVSQAQQSSSREAKSSWAAFIVDLSATTASPGIKIGSSHKFLGKDGADIASVEFDNVAINKINQLSVPVSLKTFWQELSYQNFPIIASGCVGVARSAMYHAIRYAKERVAFGQPIASYQAVSFLLADMAKDIEAARQLAWRAALAADQGAKDPVLANSCKGFAQEMVMKVTTNAVQILGAYGYCREYHTERLMRDAALYQLLCGNSHDLKSEIGQILLS